MSNRKLMARVFDVRLAIYKIAVARNLISEVMKDLELPDPHKRIQLHQSLRWLEEQADDELGAALKDLDDGDKAATDQK